MAKGNGTTDLAQVIDVVQIPEFHHVTSVFQTARHAALLHAKPGRVSDDGLLERNLRTIRERCHHRRILTPFFSETFLRGRIAVRVLQTLLSEDYAPHQ